MTKGDSDMALLTSALTLFLFWASPAWPTRGLIFGLELIGVILATYCRFSRRWRCCGITSAVAAATGVFCGTNKSEQHYFFLVPASAALCFGFLVWLGSGARLEPSIRRAAGI